MKATILGAALATLIAFPAPAFAEMTTDRQETATLRVQRITWDPVTDNRHDDAAMHVHNGAADLYSCNSGGASSLLVAGALLGLLARRRK